MFICYYLDVSFRSFNLRTLIVTESSRVPSLPILISFFYDGPIERIWPNRPYTYNNLIKYVILNIYRGR